MAASAQARSVSSVCFSLAEPRRISGNGNIVYPTCSGLPRRRLRLQRANVRSQPEPLARGLRTLGNRAPIIADTLGCALIKEQLISKKISAPPE
jgi:hypothetical protein